MYHSSHLLWLRGSKYGRGELCRASIPHGTSKRYADRDLIYANFELCKNYATRVNLKRTEAKPVDISRYFILNISLSVLIWFWLVLTLIGGKGPGGFQTTFSATYWTPVHTVGNFGILRGFDSSTFGSNPYWQVLIGSNPSTPRSIIVRGLRWRDREHSPIIHQERSISIM